MAERYTSTGAAMPAPEATSEPPHRYNTENKEEIGISTRYTVAECNGLEGDITKKIKAVTGCRLIRTPLTRMRGHDRYRRVGGVTSSKAAQCATTPSRGLHHVGLPPVTPADVHTS